MKNAQSLALWFASVRLWVLLATVCGFLVSGTQGLAQVTTSGGTQQGVKVCKEFEETNNTGQTATDLHFKAWQKEDDRYINGWEIAIDCANNASSSRSKQPSNADSPGSEDDSTHAVDVDADNMSVPDGATCKIKVCFWLTKSNTIRMADFTWTFNAGADSADGEPDNAFEFSCPVPDIASGRPQFGSGPWRHVLTITNDDAHRAFQVDGLGLLVDGTDFSNLLGLGYAPGPDQSFTLAPGENYQIEVLTTTQAIGEYIYATYNISENTGDSVQAALIALQHEIAECGSTAVPSLTQWGVVIFGALILISGVWVLRRKKRLAQMSI